MHFMAEPGANADLLSHEATFSSEMGEKARIAQHSTSAMAGAFARRLGAAQLVLTHFSSRFMDRKEVRLPCILEGRVLRQRTQASP